MNSDIQNEIFDIEPSTLIVLYELELKDTPDPNTNNALNKRYRFHSGENGFNQSIKYGNANGDFEYFYIPCQAEGFDFSEGSLPRPTITFDNSDSFFSLKTRYFQNFVGYNFVRIRTFAKFLHGSNFPNNINPFGSPTEASFPRENYVINSKQIENEDIIRFELNSNLEKEGGIVPGRKIVYNVCQWKYRETYGCGYTGTPKTDKLGEPFSSNITNRGTWNSGSTYNQGDYVKISKQYYVCRRNNTTSNPEDDKIRWSQDMCPKNIAGCRARFGDSEKENGLPFGGFPGSWPK